MGMLNIAFEILATLSALKAGWEWLRSSRVPVVPQYCTLGRYYGIPALNELGTMRGVTNAYQEAGRISQSAAIWSIIAGEFGMLALIANFFPA